MQEIVEEIKEALEESDRFSDLSVGEFERKLNKKDDIIDTKIVYHNLHLDSPRHSKCIEKNSLYYSKGNAAFRVLKNESKKDRQEDENNYDDSLG